jgi:hypothetical protein
MVVNTLQPLDKKFSEKLKIIMEQSLDLKVLLLEMVSLTQPIFYLKLDNTHIT